MRELHHFEVKMEVDESEMRLTLGQESLVKMGGHAKGSKQPSKRCRLCGKSTRVNRDLTRVRQPSSSPLIDISGALFHGKVRKVIHVVLPKDLRKKGKIWRLLKSLYTTRDASQVFATYVKEGLNEQGFQRNAVVPCLYWGAVLEALCTGETILSLAFQMTGQTT